MNDSRQTLLFVLFWNKLILSAFYTSHELTAKQVKFI